MVTGPFSPWVRDEVMMVFFLSLLFLEVLVMLEVLLMLGTLEAVVAVLIYVWVCDRVMV
jgi:hypothetical protein